MTNIVIFLETTDKNNLKTISTYFQDLTEKQ